MLSDEQVTEFQTLYKNRFGKEIDRDEAYEQGAKLMRLVELIYVPMTETDYQKVRNRKRETNEYKLVIEKTT